MDWEGWAKQINQEQRVQIQKYKVDQGATLTACTAHVVGVHGSKRWASIYTMTWLQNLRTAVGIECIQGWEGSRDQALQPLYNI